MPRVTLHDFFHDFAGLTAEFLVHDDGFRTQRFTYQQVAHCSQAFAARLRAAQVSEGDRIILYGENRPEWLMALWGALLAGVIVVPIDFRSAPEMVQRIDHIVDAKIILTGEEVTFPPSDRVWPLLALSKVPKGTGTNLPAHVSPGQTAEILFTSGATAEPKGVVITHRNILANIIPVEREVRKYLRYARPFAPIRFLNLLPLSHMFGQSMATFIPPMLPGVVVFMRGYHPHEILRQIRTRRISVLVSVPQILEILREYLLHQFPALKNVQPDGHTAWYVRWWRYRHIHDLFGWKFWSFIVGAAPLAPDLEAFFSNLGFLVIQGYGLTETAPIVTLNHPFHARSGTVGKPIGGVEVKIAGDGEILVRGDNVTTGYYGHPQDAAAAFAGGWFHTGDIGAFNPGGELKILGRKKEMIVTPEGLNVFPEDVEAVLNRQPGVKDSAVIGSDRVHAVLILHAGASSDDILRQANSQLAEFQRIRSASVWPYPEFPRTEGTRKLKRHEIAKGTPPPEKHPRFDPNVPLQSLTSLERVERMVALGLDEDQVQAVLPEEQTEFPVWNRTRLARALRRILLPGFLLPLTRMFAWIHTDGRENLNGVEPPVLFASNHQSYLDVPVILAALPPKFRYRAATAMRKEFFHGHFHGHSFTNSLNYYLSTWLFNAFPIPQREAGALESLRYMGELANEKQCVLIFPEGRMTDGGEMNPFQPGVGMMAAKLDLPVVPIRLCGLEQVLHKSWKIPRPGRVRVVIGKPLRLSGSDYLESARAVEAAVKKLIPSEKGSANEDH
jgi:long-chain acyl-CoA synthetase